MEDSGAKSASRTGAAEAKWRAIDAEQRASGLSVKAFCVTRGVSAASLFSWRRRLRPTGAKAAPAAVPVAFVEATPRPPAAEAAPARQDVRAPVELELRGGRRVLVLHRGFDAQLLRDVVAALESTA